MQTLQTYFLGNIMNKHLSLLAILGLFATAALAQPTNDGYLFDTRDNVVKSGFDLCWRTTRWTPAMAIEECDADLVKKEEAKKPIMAAPITKAAPTPTVQKMTLSADALFDFNKAVLRHEGKAKLDDLAAKVNDLNVEVIIAVGHADRIGSDAYNQKLSEKRATAVKNYLVSKNIDANRIHTEGKGEKQPVTKPGQCKGKKSKKVIACLQPDRRVEIEVIGTTKP
jgi:OOP family OmpA-OmpF porin